MLLRKARRAILQNKRSYLACIFLIAVGILMQTALGIAVAGLEGSTLGFYRSNRLADTYAKVTSVPLGQIDALARLHGIKAAQGRYVTELRAEIPGAEETITLRLIAADLSQDAPLNEPLVLEDGRQGDILLNPAFCIAHNLAPGDSISIFSAGKNFPFTVTGTAISPEYVYITKDFSQLLPDEAGFGIAFVSLDDMERLTGERGVANSLLFQREENVPFEDVRLQLEDALAPFGLSELFDQEDLPSYFFLDMEISSIKAMSTSMPMVFLLLAMVVLYLMLKRVIEQERGQIGILKAFGYSSGQIILHYMSYGLITGLAGGVLGWALGYMASGVYLQMFLQFFMLPQLSSGFDPFTIVRALALSLGSGALGAYAGVRKIIKLSPAEAMRAEAPKAVRFDLTKRLGFLRHILNSRGTMALRSITRSPIRSGFVVLSIMFSFGIISLVGSFDGMIDKMIFSQLEDIQRYEVRLSLRSPLPYEEAVEAAYGLDDVSYAEGILELPMELSHGHLKKGTPITAMTADGILYRIADTNSKEQYPPPDDGLILSNGLAGDLQAEAGDLITVSSPLLPEDVTLPVSQVIEQNLGSGCYMELTALSALISQPPLANAVILNSDNLEGLKESVKHSSMITGLEDKASTLKGYQDMMAMFAGLYVVIELLGTLVAFAIIYNTTVISLSERSREYATLRVLGLTVGEVSEIMRFEYALLSILGMLLGVPFTGLLNQSINLLVDTSLFSMPSSLPVTAYFIGAFCCIAAIALSSLSTGRKIRNFDMVEVLKERE